MSYTKDEHYIIFTKNIEINFTRMKKYDIDTVGRCVAKIENEEL